MNVLVADLCFELIIELLVLQLLLEVDLLDGHGTVNQFVVCAKDFRKGTLSNQLYLIVVFQLEHCVSLRIHI